MRSILRHVEVLFHLMINDVILSENRTACLLIKQVKSQSEFTEENSNGTVPTDYIYSDFNISNNIICDIHSQENKKVLADIVFGRTSSAAYIHRTDDLL